MSRVRREHLKSKFKAGSIPKEEDFESLIDSSLNFIDDNIKQSAENIHFETLGVVAETFTGDGAGLSNINADKITTGSLNVERIPNLDADKITSGVLDTERLPDLDANKITSGILGSERIPTLDAAKISSGILQTEQIPAIDASKVTTGKLILPDVEANFKGDGSKITGLDADNITTGTLDPEHLPLASQTSLGALQIASIDEARDSSITDLAVTPATLADVLDDSIAASQFVMSEEIAEKANQTYVDQQLALLEAGIKFKTDVQAVAVTLVDIESSKSTLQSIDGYQLQDGDRILLTNQTTRKENNRIWIAKINAPWQVADDFDGNPSEEIQVGASVEVRNGEQYRNSIWSISHIQKDQDLITEIQWTQRNDINNYQSGNGIDIEGLNVSVDLAWIEDTISLSSDKLTELDPAALVGTVPVEKLPLATDEVAGINTVYQSGDGIVIEDNVISMDSEHLAADTSFLEADGSIKRTSLPVADTQSTGIMRFATDEEIKSGQRDDLAISPSSAGSLPLNFSELESKLANAIYPNVAQGFFVSTEFSSANLGSHMLMDKYGVVHYVKRVSDKLNYYKYEMDNTNQWVESFIVELEGDGDDPRLATDHKGTLYLASRGENGLRTVDKDGNMQVVDSSSRAFKITQDSLGNVFVGNKIYTFDDDVIDNPVVSVFGDLVRAIDRSGFHYVLPSNSTISKYSPDGQHVYDRNISMITSGAYTMAVDDIGVVFIGDYHGSRVIVSKPDGAEFAIGSGGHSMVDGRGNYAELQSAYGVFMGRDNKLYVSGNGAVRKITW
jgi:hypothetical protein